MVLIDYESFHLRLIAELIDYQLPKEPVHQYLGKMYFEKDELTQEEYDESKRITFRYLYSDDRMQNPPPFFKKIYEYIDGLWDVMHTKGVIYSPHARPIFKHRIENPTPAKLFNYLVQLFETEEVATMVLDWQLMFAKTAASKMVLYTYDSLLFDYNLADGKELLLKTVELMERGGKYPVRVYYGEDYHTMKRLELQGEPHAT
jgi:hypothetical protein